ncbi:hypothetical protein DAH66_12830 [Sphingomonas koreensis]|uniref:Uncharacterized protein n=1 Tax=Sphingomonas koreensis TaxID=93064 RepID=A0A430G2E2_9SPHN|nr:hypothetical protein [Sphingomonas koreensis]RSY83147.1 hypothetical protein DAH66_12830 [Sphingomonas koreensis]
MRAEDVRKALAKKFGAPEYALFFEVGDATGGRARRWADAVAMGLWPSRGLALQGFEIKVSRQDWLGELRKPEKAEAIARYCRYWWIVTPPGIVKDGELPENWGLYEVQANGLRIVRAAPPREKLPPISPEFLAALLRRSDEHARSLVKNAIDTAMVDERAAIDARVEREVHWRTDRLKERAEAAEGKFSAICEACGLSPAEVGGLFYNTDFARAVATVHRLGVAKTYNGLSGLAQRLRPMIEALDGFLGEEPSE